MEGFFEGAKDRLVRLAPSLLQVETGMSPDAADVFALNHTVSALVHPLSDMVDPIAEACMMVTQREVWTFGVTMALVFPGGFPEWVKARAEIKAALRGWTGPDGLLATPVEYAGGQTTQYSINQEGGRWLHVLRFRASLLETYEQLL